MSFIVAIDGPAGSGKGSVTEILSKELGLINIGSGSAYRCVALATIQRKIDPEDTEKIIKMLNEIDIEFKMQDGKDVVYLNEEDVSSRIRENDVANIVAQISAIKEVRFRLNDIFRKCAEGKKVIMEGRDIGTYVFPNADVKLYFDATPEERARRRFEQNKASGIETNYEDVLENIKLRDKTDMEKEIGALKQAEDAIYIDSTNMSVREQVEVAKKVILEKFNG